MEVSAAVQQAVVVREDLGKIKNYPSLTLRKEVFTMRWLRYALYELLFSVTAFEEKEKTGGSFGGGGASGSW